MNTAVEDSNTIPVQESDVTFTKSRHITLFQTPVGILEEAVAFADAPTRALTFPLLLRKVMTDAASSTTLNVAASCSRKLEVARVPLNVLDRWCHVCIVQQVCRPIQQEPRS